MSNVLSGPLSSVVDQYGRVLREIINVVTDEVFLNFVDVS